MAIIIPSKNIYDIQNPKIRDNLIDNVSVEQTIIKPNNEYEISVYNEDIELNNLVSERNATNEDFNYEVENDDVSVWYNYGYVYLDNIAKYKEGTITIPKLNGTNYISKIFTEKDEQGNSKIGVSLRGNIITQNTTRTVNWDRRTSPFYSVGSIEYTNEKIEKGKVFEFPQMPIEITSPVILGQYTGASVSGLSNNTNYTVFVWDDDNNYYISYKILVYLFINQLSGGIIEQGDTAFTGSFEASGTCIEYNPEQLEITIYGNTIGIDLTDGTVTYGSGNKPHTLSGNELMQDSATVNKTSLTKHLANNVLSQYAKGKETAVILCDINEYYDDQNNLVISTKPNYRFVNNLPYKISAVDGGNHYTIGAWFENDYTHNRDVRFEFLSTIGEISQTHYILIEKGESFSSITIDKKETETPRLILTNMGEILPMTFEIGDEVIPYVFGADGKDKPMSLKQDGTPKVFVVVGTNKIYDGAVWQELYLQEK